MSRPNPLAPRFAAHAAVAAGLTWATAAPPVAPAETPAPPGPRVADAAKAGAAKPGAARKDAPKVRARAFLSTDRLPAGRTAEVAVVLDVADGWHVHSNPVTRDYAVPTTVTVRTGRGTTVGKFVYPTLPPERRGGPRRPVPHLAGRVVLRAPVSVPAGAAGGDETLEVSVKYQACDDAQCLRPKTLTFGGTLPVAAPGEPVTPANRKWFRAPEPGPPDTRPPATRTAERP